MRILRDEDGFHTYTVTGNTNHSAAVCITLDSTLSQHPHTSISVCMKAEGSITQTGRKEG